MTVEVFSVASQTRERQSETSVKKRLISKIRNVLKGRTIDAIEFAWIELRSKRECESNAEACTCVVGAFSLFFNVQSETMSVSKLRVRSPIRTARFISDQDVSLMHLLVLSFLVSPSENVTATPPFIPLAIKEESPNRTLRDAWTSEEARGANQGGTQSASYRVVHTIQGAHHVLQVRTTDTVEPSALTREPYRRFFCSHLTLVESRCGRRDVLDQFACILGPSCCLPS